MTSDSSTLFWVTSRAAGATAMVLSSAAVGVGLTMGGKLMKRWAVDRRSLHEVLSLSVMIAIAVHGLALLGDSWLHPSLAQVTVPFAASYKTILTSIGIIAGWGFIILGLSFYARKRIGITRWKLIHRFTALAWLL
jgi:methionine sulfoxide reductase heme-binding subunit